MVLCSYTSDDAAAALQGQGGDGGRNTVHDESANAAITRCMTALDEFMVAHSEVDVLFVICTDPISPCLVNKCGGPRGGGGLHEHSAPGYDIE